MIGIVIYFNVKLFKWEFRLALEIRGCPFFPDKIRQGVEV